MTGLEPLLGPAIAKAAGAGAARAGIWGTKQLLSHRRRTQIEAELDVPVAALAEFSDPDLTTRLLDFFGSPEVEHFANALAQLYLVERANRKSKEILEDIENEFYYSLARFVGVEPKSATLRLLFAALNEAVLVECSRISMKDELSPALQAQLVRTAGSLAASSARNAELLSSVARLDEYMAFHRVLKAQISALHSTMRLPHAGTTRQVPYDDLFVTPDIWLPPTDGGASKSTTLAEILSVTNRVVVLGDPGGGKSTLANKLAYDIAADQLANLKDRVPFIVTLRDYFSPTTSGQERRSILDYLNSCCESPYQIEPPVGALEYLLLNGRAVVIFDGLDELLDTSLRRDVVQAVEGFSHRFPTCQIVVTSRRVGYPEAPLDEAIFAKIELGKFSAEQVRSYVQKWFQLDESVLPAVRERLTTAFLADSAFVSDLRSNPLLLSLMCGIYASENYIPANRPDVYEKCALLLFDRWDRQRGISAPLPFDAHVQGAMRSLALFMFTEHPTEEAIARSKLVGHITSYLRDRRFATEEEAENAANEFIDFCQGRAWVLTDIGSDLYGFTHRTFMEYFAASQLVRLNTSAESLYSELEGNLREENWDVVAQLSLQILGKTVEDGADDFLQLLLEDARSRKNDRNLLSFACRALEFVVPRPQIIELLVKLVIESVANSSDHGSFVASEGLYRILLEVASRENLPRVLAAAQEALRGSVSTGRVDEKAMILAIASPQLAAKSPERAANREALSDWTRQNRVEFSSSYRALQKRHSWLCVDGWEWGNLSTAELLQYRGPRALYEYRIHGLLQGPPIAYSFLYAIILGREEMLGTYLRSGSRRSMSQVSEEFYSELPRFQDRIWFRYVRDFERVAEILDADETATKRNEEDERPPWLVAPRLGVAGLLLSLPLVEIKARCEPAWLASGHATFLPAHQIGRLRANGNGLDSAAGVLSEILAAADKAQLELFNRWVDRAFTCTSPRPRKAQIGRFWSVDKEAIGTPDELFGV